MTSAVRRYLLFFFSIAALSSCEDPTDIGIDLQDENLIGTNYTELEVKTGTVLLDTLSSSRVVPVLLGRYTDPELGAVSASVATQVSLNSTTLPLTFGNTPQLNSLELTIDYSHIYGDKTKPITLNVYQLSEMLDEKLESQYTNSRPINYEPTSLGSVTFTPALLQKKASGASGDSTTAQNLVKVQLSSEFANKILANTFTKQSEFNTSLKGLAIVPAGDAASMLALKLSADSTKMVLRYTDGGTKKKHTFTLSQSGNLLFYTNITGDRAGTAVEALTKHRDYIPSETTGGKAYVQTNTQLVTKLNFPELEKLKEQLGNVVINRAELILPVENNSTIGALAPVPQLVLYQTNETNHIQKTKLQDGSNVPLTVQQDIYGVNTMGFTAPLQYNSDKKRYSLNITSYVQAMFFGNKPNKGLLLAPARVTVGSNGQTSEMRETTPFRSIISNSGDQKVKLLIYYSKVSK